MNISPVKKALYALGQFGLVLSGYGVGRLFISFFVTRGFSGAPSFPNYLYPGYLFGFFTVAGFIIALSRLTDAASCLFSAYVSDRRAPGRGRRTFFMLISAAPLALFSALVFFPPSSSSYLINSIFVLVATVLFYFFLSLYTIPYLALLAEIGVSTRDRMQISTLMAGATAFASLLGNRVFTFMDMVGARAGLSQLQSFRVIMIVYAGVSVVCMMLPVLFVDEKRFRDEEPVRDGFRQLVATVFKDSYFRHYLISDMTYRVASSVLITGFALYSTELLGLPESVTSNFLLLVFFVNLILYLPVALLTRRIGKRKLLFSAFFLMIVFLSFASGAGKYPLSPSAQGYILAVLAAIPVAIFTVIPNALIADLAVVSARKTGIRRSGMYFGLFQLFSQTCQLLTALVFPSVIALGATGKGSGAVGRTGLRVSLIIAAVLCLIGFLSLFGYREKEVSDILDRKE